MAFIDVSSVSKSFGTGPSARHVLDDVTLSVERGEFVSPHKIISLLALYLVREKGLSGELVKTFSTTRLIEKVAAALGATLHETPIGFKYVADLMLARDVLVGGEESGGIGFAAVRGGQVVGEHTLIFAAATEHIALTHRAFDRRAFATGAVRAALWVARQKPGLYSMMDVLGMA